MQKMSYKAYLPLLVSVFLLAQGRAQQDAPSPWLAPANDLVREILFRSGAPAAILVNFENLSSLSAPEQEAIQKAVLDGFRAAGIRLVKADFALAEVQIAFSEDWRDYVWVASIRQGTGNRTLVRKVPRLPQAAAARAPALTIKTSLVWRQDGPILDFFSDGQSLLVLEPEQLAVYANDSGQWRLKQTLSIAHERPWPRDLRGRLQVTTPLASGSQITNAEMEPSRMSAFLPGTLCGGTFSPPALQCHASDDPWRVDQDLVAFFSPARNFFTGVLAGASAGENVPQFFSAAALGSGNARQWVFAGTDGRARLYQDNLSSPAATLNAWGASLAGVRSSCGSGGQILVTSPGDPAHADALEAVEIHNREAVSASPSVDLSGPVMALWPGENGQNVHGVVQSLATGKYEALIFTVACTQ